jgi:hypothetical protein
VDRHGLRPRDDKGGIFTMKGMKKIEVLKFVIARRERSEGRGNPSCLGIYCLRVRFGYCGTVDRHARKGLAMTRVILESAVRLRRVSGSPRAFSPRDDKDDVCA